MVVNLLAFKKFKLFFISNFSILIFGEAFKVSKLPSPKTFSLKETCFVLF
jgi:hypothetical protein